MISLEAWDSTWRRNQYLSHELVVQGHAQNVIFIEPPGRGPTTSREVEDRVLVIRPGLLAPRRCGGLAATALSLRLNKLRGVDLIWVNNAVLGRHLVGHGRAAALYDVTDDWRASTQHPRVRRRHVAAEDALAVSARTVVCSLQLRDLWSARYDVNASVVANGADVTAIRAATARPLVGQGPHAVYVGTLHRDRLDLDLITATAAVVGRLHLVGPNALDAEAETQLKQAANVEIHGPVSANDVAGWLVAADVLICPHAVTDFTRSLDAIKAHEYLATERPVVATPTSGFTGLDAHEGVFIADATGFTAAVTTALGLKQRPSVTVSSWADQAALFAAELRAAV